MKKFAVFIVSAALFSINVAGCAADSSRHYSLSDVQGAWWSKCSDPAVEFLIQNDRYSGDFFDDHKLSVKDNILTFEDGLVVGHDVNVSGTPLAFLIISISPSELVLRRVTAERDDRDWRLLSCK
ncbi:MAG: hypothetical protein LBE24_06075 [Methylobacillus sp.]|nr:hypothetical protein [Methylobacillus sp.]